MKIKDFTTGVQHIGIFTLRMLEMLLDFCCKGSIFQLPSQRKII
jgi:hypothetical protein